MLRLLKFVAVTLTALLLLLETYGDPARRPEVSRAAPATSSLADFAGLAERVDARAHAPRPSEAEAVALALATGRAGRDARAAQPKIWRGAVGAEAVVAATLPQDLWYVSGSKVNLRQGPGSRNAVVAQVTLGTEALVIDQRGKWLQIETTDGRTTGWIFGKYLADQKPG
ncbi:MAG: SH3 domain-containing protein [Silicimonas sp.]|nr:SH3 domain-containing protein [Silicimonas sp.]